MRPDTLRHDSAPYGWGALLSLLAVVYLTLLPFEFRELALADAWQQYLGMERGRVRSSARQQWVANALMFLPLGFFLTAWLTVNLRNHAARLLLAMLVCGFCLLVTMAVEFGQIWLAYRNPSLNDISANFVGGVIGAMIWLVAAWRVAPLVTAVRRDGLHISARRMLTLYAAFYVVVSLLPFDFFLSLSELRGRFESEHWNWWMRADHCGETPIRCAMLDAFKYLLAVPLGLWLYRLFDGRRVALALLAAVVFGVVVEVAQFLLVTGRADGFSALLRVAGAASGVLLAPALGRVDIGRLRNRWGRLLALLLVIPYVWVVVALVPGTRDFHWDVALAREQFQSLRFLPFYYHYFVPEAVAIRSVLLSLMLYAPAGVLVWLWTRGSRGFPAVLLGALFALTIEALKLFVEGLRPDPTSVLIGGVAALGGLRLLDWLTGTWIVNAVTVSVPSWNADVQNRDVVGPVRASSPRPPPRRLDWWPLVSGLLLAGCAVFAALRHPLAPEFALVAVIVHAGIILRWPSLWLLLVPATLPVLDLTPWTGQLYFDEWDLLVVTTLAALFLRRGWVGWSSQGSKVQGAGRVWLVLFLLSYTTAVVIALWPPTWPGALEFTSLHSPYNALRLAKGVLWALLLWPFFAAAISNHRAAFDRFSLGMVLGLAAAVVSVLWERFLFTGLFDFATSYRVVGMFSGTHTGGAFLEGYLVAAVPFLAMALVWRHRWLWWPAATVLFVLASYAVAVTFARAGYAGLLVAVMVILVATLWRFGSNLQSRLAAIVILLLVTSCGLAVLDHVQQGEFMSPRVDIERIQDDWETRVEHWQQSLEPVLADIRATWVGLGVGRFPEIHFWKSVLQEHPLPAIYKLSERDDGVILTLMPGRFLFFWQALTVEPETEYRVRLIGRAGEERARLTVLLCEKWVLYSRRCQRGRLEFESGAGWQSLETVLKAPAQLTGYRFAERPSKLILYHASRHDYLDLASVSLLDPAGRELLANGDFSQGMDRWFFTSDDHLAWHIKNLWVQVFFEQGLIGLVTWTLLVLTALWGAIRQIRAGGPEGWQGAVLLAALSSFLTVGLFDSLFDVPRLATLFFLLVLLVLSDGATGEVRRRAGL